MDGSVRVNPFLQGNYGPIRSEDNFELAVKGEIPAALAGTLYRTGPNPQFEPRDGEHHWFFGDGMVHAFEVEDGKVHYRNRYVRTPKWIHENRAGRSLYGSFGNPMTSDRSTLGRDSGVANTNIVSHGGRLLALEEVHPPFELEHGTLESKDYRKREYRGRMTAHPKIDPETGEMVFFSYMDGTLPLAPVMGYGVVDATGKLVRRERFRVPYFSMVHDFMVTRRHALFPILPLTGSGKRLMAGEPLFAWEPDKAGFIGVIDRREGARSLRWFNIDACYVFHVLNAWDEGDTIVCDVMKYPRAPLFAGTDGSGGGSAVLTRWRLDLAGDSDAVREEVLDDLPGEFPRIDDRFAMSRNRHGWFAGVTNGRRGSISMDTLSHIDLDTGKRTDWVAPIGDAVSEPVFVERSRDAAEGDGWIVAVIYRADKDCSELAVFDAQDMAAGPIGLALMPRRMPFGFHGNWVNA